MSETCETVKIESAEAPNGYVVINKEDFDEKTQTLYVEPSDGLSSSTKAELVDLAESKGIDTKGMTKAEIVEALKAAEG
jgi:hypothetical protein